MSSDSSHVIHSIDSTICPDVHIVGFAGRKESGKGVATNVAVSHGYREMSFASPIKDAARAMFGFSDAQLYGSEKESPDRFWGVVPRRVFQEIGSFYRGPLRSLISNSITTTNNTGPSESFVVAKLRRDISVARENGEKIVVSDVRFPEEAEMIRSLGGRVILIDRPSHPRNDNDPSETACDSIVYDVMLSNDSTIPALEDLVRQYV